jgi:glycosyltransferase involved in cell wall biosynthesis
MKIVVISHAHPTFSKGGAELAAYYLWQGINSLSGHESWFIGRGQPELMHQFTTLAAIGEREYLLAGNANIEQLTATTSLDPQNDLSQLLASIQPDVVHFHHYVHVGVETIRLVKNICPQAKIFMTLHEYIAICQNNGQMVKTNGRLCYQYSPRECHLCFPHIPQENIFLREIYIKSFFKLVDQFIAPSKFLRERYIQWGLKPERISVIENGLPESEKIPPRKLRTDEIRGKFAYFGQINPYKGVDVILEALINLPKKTRKKVTLDIFGSGLESQTQAFQDKIHLLIKKCKDSVRLHGAYEPEEMPRLIAETDWVVMGSIWWENSPLVIQEAYKFGRPLIVPDIGGMAEKVQPGEGGLTYRARDSFSLANLISTVIEDQTMFDEIHSKIPAYPKISSVVKEHLQLFANVS